MVCLLLNDTNYGDIKLYQHKHLKESPFFLRISASEEQVVMRSITDNSTVGPSPWHE